MDEMERPTEWSIETCDPWLSTQNISQPFDKHHKKKKTRTLDIIYSYFAFTFFLFFILHSGIFLYICRILINR